jgi:glutamate formiminotransferase
MSTLVECVPNFSEGRDKSVVDAIVDAMKIPGVSLKAATKASLMTLSRR